MVVIEHLMDHQVHASSPRRWRWNWQVKDHIQVVQQVTAGTANTGGGGGAGVYTPPGTTWWQGSGMVTIIRYKFQ